MYKIVLADDEYMIKRGVTKLIETSGAPFEVVGEAEDGREALALIERWSPDLLITDIRMPAMDGLELIEAIAAGGWTTEIVILSGYDDFSYAQRALQMGAFDYLLKPIKPAMFRDMLERLTDKLERKREAASKRSEWLLLTNSRSAPLADAIWLLNEEAAYEALDRLHADYTADDPSPEQLMERYADLFTLLAGELEIRQQEPLQSTASPIVVSPGGWPDSPDEQLQAARRVLSGWMEELRATRKWGAHHYLHRAVEYMKEHYAESEVDLNRVALVAEMSPSYFSRMFKQELGVSFVHYLTQLRLDAAKTMLEDARFKTYEIALQVGYEDYPHFAKVFKKQLGVSPTDYRKRLGIK